MSIWERGQGDIAGHWTRAPFDNCIRLTLTTPLQALTDKSIASYRRAVQHREEKQQPQQQSFTVQKKSGTDFNLESGEVKW